MSFGNKKMASEAIVEGKKPIAQKKKIDLAAWAPIGSALHLPPELMKKADQDGIQFRWLRAKHIAENSGYHKMGWRVYEVENPEELGLHDFHIGREGNQLRRGTMILGYKPKEAADYHRKGLQEKADRQLGFEGSKADQLRQKAQSANLNTRVYEGYDENG